MEEKQMLVGLPEEIETKLDLLYLNKVVEGAEHLRFELIKIFIEVVTKESEDIEYWYKEKEWKALCFSFHKIRSNLRMMGFQWLAYKAEVYEKCCKNLENLEQIDCEIEWFLGELNKGILQAERLVEEEYSALFCQKSPPIFQKKNRGASR